MIRLSATKRALSSPQRLRPGLWALLGICPLALGGLSGCCVKPSKVIDRHGPPDVVYELRGGTGRWYWYGDEAPPRASRPNEIGFFWLDQGHQAAFTEGCQTYSGPVRSEDWARFEQARIEQARLEERQEQADQP